jgi:hypothetical protein
MVTIGFIVEGDTEKILIESDIFKSWANQQGISICLPVLNAKGGGNLLPENIEPLIKRLKSKNPDHIVILTDLEHEANPQAVKNRIGTQYTNLIFIAVKAIEAWFLADSIALSQWLKTKVFEEYPEETATMPWERLRELAEQLKQKGTGSNKPRFAQRMTQYYGFELARAANHPNCPSAKEFHDGLIALAK